MDLAEWHRHAFLNRLQAIVLLALLGYLIWGPAGVLQLLFMGIVFALVHPLASPWLVLRLYRARPLRPSEAPALNAAAELAHRAELPSLYFQVKTVVLIALIAVSRKFVILDTATTEATKIAAWPRPCWPWGGCTGCYVSATSGRSNRASRHTSLAPEERKTDHEP